MRSTLRRAFAPYAHARVWKESAHLLLDLVVGIALFTVVVTMVSLSVGLLITLVGLPLLLATIVCGRWVGTLERTRARALLDVDLAAFRPLRVTGTLWERVRIAASDTPGWKGLLYGIVMLPWGIVTFTLTVVMWAVAFPLALFPCYGWWLPHGDGFFQFGLHYRFEGFGRIGYVAGVSLIGWVLVGILPRVIHAYASADVRLMRALLSPSKESELEQRVSELQISRDASVESSTSELRRIERDLHDGAQQQLVSLAMNLGLAKERLCDSDDERAKALVSQAHDEAKQAIIELRDLVRGIHPAVLTDRGLDAAVSALAARCTVPVTLQCTLSRRLPSSIESTAYFVVAEALTNVAKHSGASTASVRLAEETDRISIEVHDDGVGGAVLAESGGLHGLDDRVRAVEGQLHLSSPAGGPTVLLVELPCAS